LKFEDLVGVFCECIYLELEFRTQLNWSIFVGVLFIIWSRLSVEVVRV
jgi:hypothetical protein